MPKGNPGIKRRPKTQAEKDHQRDMITKRWQDPVYRQRVSDGLNDYWLDPEHHEERREIANQIIANTDWRKNVSEGTKKALAIPEVKARHSAGVKQAFLSHNNFMGGEVGDSFALVLCPAGFTREHRVYYGEPTVQIFGDGRRRKKNLSLDFAHIKGRVNIELDGPGHIVFPDGGDDVRDAMLRDLGWRVIRIRHA